MNPAADAAHRLSHYQQRAEDVARRAATAQAELAAIAVTVTSRDGAVTLTVNPAGALQALGLGPPADDLSRTQLAATVLATQRRAHGAAAGLAADAMRPLLGDGTPAFAALRAYLPEPPADAGSARGTR